MRRELFWGVILSGISGLMLWLSFPSVSFFPLAWFGLVPYLYFILQKPSWLTTTLGHATMACIYFGGVLYWVPRVLVVHGNINWPTAITAYVLLIAILGGALFPFTFLVRRTAQSSRRMALWCAPGFWVLTELFRNYYPMNGFPWGSLGYSQFSYSWIIQLADVGGIYLVSFLVVAANSAILAVLMRRSFWMVSIFSMIFLIINIYGIFCHKIWKEGKETGIQVALVQPNISLGANQDHYAKKYFEKLPEYFRKVTQEGSDWVIFPEAPNPFFYGEDFYFTNFWEREVSSQQAYLLFNATTIAKSTSMRYFNSAILLDPQGRKTYQYNKTHLVPFGEYLPFQEWLGFFIEPLVGEVSSYSPGQQAVLLGDVSGTRFATLICYEGIFPELSRKVAGQGAEILINITNDAWYGRTSAPRQHLEMSAFRAIENRKPFLRVANSGYSAIINPLGKVIGELGLYQEGVLRDQIRGNSYRSVYSYVGEWIIIVLIAVTVLCSSVSRFQRTRKQKYGKKLRGKRRKED